MDDGFSVSADSGGAAKIGKEKIGPSHGLSSSTSLSSEGSSDEDEDSPPEELVDGKSDAETWFDEQNMCVKVLVAMCHGMFEKKQSTS